MGTCCRHEGCIAAMGNLLQLGCCRQGGGLVTGMGTCRGGGGELDILTQMAGGVALSIQLANKVQTSTLLPSNIHIPTEC